MVIFKILFSSYFVSNLVVVAKDACYRVMPHNVSIGNWDRLDKEFV